MVVGLGPSVLPFLHILGVTHWPPWCLYCPSAETAGGLSAPRVWLSASGQAVLLWRRVLSVCLSSSLAESLGVLGWPVGSLG